MTTLGYLTGTLVMGALTVGVVLSVDRSRRWRSYSQQLSTETDTSHGEGTVRLPVVGHTRLLTLAVLVFVGATVGFLGATVATLSGDLEPDVLVAGLGVVLVGYFVHGVLFSSGLPRHLERRGYALHRTVTFRSRPRWSMVVGWTTFLVILIVISLVVLGLWIAGTGPVGFLLALALIGLLVARYATSWTGVGLVPSPASGRGGSTVRTTVRTRSTSGADHTVTEGRFELGRALPVLRGWLTVAVLLTIGAAASVSLWIVGGGPAGLLVGLLVVGLFAAWYAVSGTW